MFRAASALTLLALSGLAQAQLEEESITRVAFGSCLHQNQDAPIWPSIHDFDPEVFVFLGDNIYGDTEEMDVLRSKYAKLRGSDGYRKLNESAWILATWDDHDYGVNDGGLEYPMRAEAQQEFLAAFEVPEDRRAHEGAGIYDAWEVGELGERLQIILLDTRYFRSPLVKLETRSKWGPYGENTDPDATMLGEEQWEWLAEVLQRPADLRIIASSIQVLAADHHWERWENIPAERARLLELLKASEVQHVIFASGDRHLAEVMKMSTPSCDFYELTTSGLNRAGGGNADEPNRHRIGENYRQQNFGAVIIDWEEGSAEVQVLGLDGDPVRSMMVSFGKKSP